MNSIGKVEEARGWKEYYDAYGAIYAEVLMARWALGKVSFAGHIHDTAIPDASGKLAGGVSWAAYSQPSADTLIAFLGVFRELIEREPHRAMTNRYCFFCLTGPRPNVAEVEAALGKCGTVLSYFVGTLDEELKAPEWTGPVRATEALYGINPRRISHSNSETSTELVDGLTEFDLWARQLIVDRVSNRMSRTEAVVVGSSILLAGYKAGIDVAEVVRIVGTGASVAALIAERRASLSGWGGDAATYLREVGALTPVETEVHKIQPGDILGRIVREKYSVPFSQLWPIISALNPDIRDPNKIVAGREILLPVL